MLLYIILAAIIFLLIIGHITGKIKDKKVKTMIQYIDNDIVLAYKRSRYFHASYKNNEWYSSMLISLYNNVYWPKKYREKPYSYYCIFGNETSCFSEDTFIKMEEYLNRYCKRGFVLSFAYIAILAHILSSIRTYDYKLYRYCYERVGPSCDLGSEMSDYIEDFHVMSIANNVSSSCYQDEIEYTVFHNLFLSSLFYNRESFFRTCIDKLNDIYKSDKADDKQKKLISSIIEKTLTKTS